MKTKRPLVSIVALIMSLTMFAYSFSTAASAIVNKNGSITLHVADATTGKVIENASFRLYFFAAAYEKNNGVGYDYVVPYDGCNMDMGNLQDAYLPVHLTHFALTHDLPYTVKSSDKNGSIVFDNLVPGVYLIVPMGDIPDYFMPSPFVINIPLYDKENKNWVYDINATPKMVIHLVDSMVETTYLSVKKLWDTTASHPDSVVVSLLCDYREVEKVTLSESNGWYYRWDNLSAKHNWSVVESKVPDGFKVSYETSSKTVKIINTGTSAVENTKPSAKPTKPGEKPTEVPTTKPEELIDTGQLNWPIPIFAAAGMLLFSAGWSMLKFGKKDEEAV